MMTSTSSAVTHVITKYSRSYPSAKSNNGGNNPLDWTHYTDEGLRLTVDVVRTGTLTRHRLKIVQYQNDSTSFGSQSSVPEIVWEDLDLTAFSEFVSRPHLSMHGSAAMGLPLKAVFREGMVGFRYLHPLNMSHGPTTKPSYRRFQVTFLSPATASEFVASIRSVVPCTSSNTATANKNPSAKTDKARNRPLSQNQTNSQLDSPGTLGEPTPTGQSSKKTITGKGRGTVPKKKPAQSGRSTLVFAQTSNSAVPAKRTFAELNATSSTPARSMTLSSSSDLHHSDDIAHYSPPMRLGGPSPSHALPRSPPETSLAPNSDIIFMSSPQGQVPAAPMIQITCATNDPSPALLASEPHQAGPPPLKRLNTGPDPSQAGNFDSSQDSNVPSSSPLDSPLLSRSTLNRMPRGIVSAHSEMSGHARVAGAPGALNATLSSVFNVTGHVSSSSSQVQVPQQELPAESSPPSTINSRGTVESSPTDEATKSLYDMSDQEMQSLVADVIREPGFEALINRMDSMWRLKTLFQA